MEYLSKREYLRRYVSRVDQLRIGVLGLLVLFGGAIGIALGLRGQNHGLALWGLLIAVMGLGVLQFQSLACSVGTMVCGRDRADRRHESHLRRPADSGSDRRDPAHISAEP